MPLIPVPCSVAAHSPARQRRKEARPQELLHAALALFVEKGFAATRIEEVAERAGVSKGTLYLYYPSKEELLKAVIREYLSNQIEAGAEQVRLHVGSNAELLRTLLCDWWLGVFDSPAAGVFKLVITEVRSFPEIAAYYSGAVIEPGSQLVADVLERGIADGEFREVNVEAAVHSLVLPMVMLCVHKHSLGVCVPMDALLHPEVFVRQHMELIITGLLKPSDAAATKLQTESPRSARGSNASTSTD
jgi:AcrR family transcriptional regulator